MKFLTVHFHTHNDVKLVEKYLVRNDEDEEILVQVLSDRPGITLDNVTYDDDSIYQSIQDKFTALFDTAPLSDTELRMNQEEYETYIGSLIAAYDLVKTEQ